MSESLVDYVWKAMSRLVIDNKDTWRRLVVERTGLPFSRIRVLRKLDRHPLTVKQIAEAVAIDAPAASVAVNDLEFRGLVVRREDPANRRCKLVSLTEKGRDVIALIEATDDPPPASLVDLSHQDLHTLRGLLDKLERG
jgi:DNA-binding MarR family transcriptional regulator